MKKLFVLCLVLFGIVTQLLSQTYDRNTLIVSQVFSIAKNIEWPGKKEKLNIVLISQNNGLVEEFVNVLDKQIINEQQVFIYTTTDKFYVENADLIFVEPYLEKSIPIIYDKIKGKPILLITESYTDDHFKMINLISSSDGGYTLEMNNENIDAQGLEVLPDIFISGVTKYNLFQLYLKSQDSLRILQLKIRFLERRQDSLISNMSDAKQVLSRQTDRIRSQNLEIESKQAIIFEQTQSLDSVRDNLYLYQADLDSFSRVLQIREKKLSNLQIEIEEQSNKLNANKGILDQQRRNIELQDEEINKQLSEIEEAQNVMDSQQAALLFSILFSIIVAIGTILIFRAYSIRKRDAQKLAQQKEELSVLVDELHQTQTQLVQSEKMASLGVLTAGIAHEINNAINFVYSGIYIIENKFSEIKPFIDQFKTIDDPSELDEQKVEELLLAKSEVNYEETQDVIDSMIKNVQIGAERTTEIVKGLRSFSRSEDEERTKIDIHQDIEVALLLLNSKYRNTIKLDTSYDEKIPLILGYQGQLGQAFLNIIGNAIDAVKARNQNPIIKINTRLRNKNIEISIRDNGVGMTKETQDKIFDPFYTTKGVGAGTGLGLSITYGIIEKHGGHITVSSAINAGSEFIIFLPLNN